ncbi:MAG: glycine dehydrogenase, partial [Magnetococcales bacterium]|nr:glycine dehydrogenase [Magnetococcales bacterium]
PGEWGRDGADIACGDAQPFGAPLSSGGPYVGFMGCRKAHMRQIPGRLVGRSVDRHGTPGFVLTLQAREQHIRRSRATSNICTNQGLMAIAAAIHMSLLGPEGLRQTALTCHARMISLLERLDGMPGVKRRFNRPCFHEAALVLHRPVAEVLEAMAARGFEAGYQMVRGYDEMENELLVCATETKSEVDLARYAEALRVVLGSGEAGA